MKYLVLSDYHEFIPKLIKKILRVGKCLFNRFITIPFILVPYLRKKFSLTNNYSLIKVHNGCVIIAKDAVYKAGFGRLNTIQEEYELRSKAVNIWIELDTILAEVDYLNEKGLQCLRMPLYKKTTLDNSIIYAVKIYNQLKLTAVSHDKNKLIDELYELKYGLNLIKNKVSKKTYELINLQIADFFKRDAYTVGFAHGDFHSRNIMIDQYGVLKLIDLDCLRIKGIQEFDALNYIVEYVWSKNGQHWVCTLTNIINNSISSEILALINKFEIKNVKTLCLVYFTDRIGQERSKYEIKCPNILMKKMINAAILSGSKNYENKALS